jgi:putative transposase
MGHKHRIELPGGLFHVTARGNAQDVIFRDDLDYLGFIRGLAEEVSRHEWLCHSFCLMPNHYHLLLETPKPNVGVGMHRLNGSYARRFNARHGRAGHLFQGPYHAQVLQRDEHLLEVCRYIALNPVRGGLCTDPAAWRWSSHGGGHSFVDRTLVRDLFGHEGCFESFVADGIDVGQPG